MVKKPSKEVMDVREAARYLGITPDTLYKYIQMAKIPAFKLGNRWRFKKSLLDQWMEDKSKLYKLQKTSGGELF